MLGLRPYQRQPVIVQSTVLEQNSGKVHPNGIQTVLTSQMVDHSAGTAADIQNSGAHCQFAVSHPPVRKIEPTGPDDYVWRYVADPPEAFYSAFISSAQRLLALFIAAHSLRRVLEMYRIDWIDETQPFWIDWPP